MQETINFLNKVKTWSFYGFLITFTFSIRKVLFFYPIRGQFNEYTGIYLYLSDIFLLLMLASGGLFILCNKIFNKSSSNLNLTPYLKQKIVIIPLFLVIFSFASISWSNNWQLAIFRSLKLLELFLLYLWITFQMFYREYKDIKNCSTWNIFNNSVKIIIFTGVIQSIIAIWQFIIQKSIGLIWIKESIISPDISGVAKIMLDGEKYIRSYGLFPHPNILAGFLVFSIILTGAYFKLFHVKHKSDENCSTWNNYICCIVLGIQGLALFLTFSKSAWIGLSISILYLCYQNDKSVSLIEEYGMFFKKRVKKLFHVEHFKQITLVVGIIILLIIAIKPNFYSIIGKSIEDRMFYLNVSRGTFMKNPFLGIGSGQFVLNLENIKNIQDWQFQPVHNVFLIILNELGILGLVLFIFFIWEIMKNVPRGTFYNYLKGIFLGFLFVMLFDHYFWDIQQGQVMFWLILGMIVGVKMCISNKFTGLTSEKKE